MPNDGRQNASGKRREAARRPDQARRRAELFFIARLARHRAWGVQSADARLRDCVGVLLARGATRASIADGAGVDRAWFVAWLAGRRPLSSRQVRRLQRWAAPVLAGSLT